MSEPVLVTGAAGFIGMHVARRLLESGRAVLGVDNLNAFYDPRLKEARLAELAGFPAFRFERTDIADRPAMAALFAAHRFDLVVHLAAQASVRHSLVDPHAYGDSNLTGFLNILEGCRHCACRHLVFASSSSVYGANTRLPLRTRDNVDHPLSLYGATKKANELMAHAYADFFAIPTTGLRFFTVYGPWGRPDMAVWRFTAAIDAGQPIQLFNGGTLRRDFTYIDDVAEAVMRVVARPPAADPSWKSDVPDAATSRAPWRIYNIGSTRPVAVTELVRLIERALGRQARCEVVPMQPGDMTETYADIADLERDFGFAPAMPLDRGIDHFVAWYRRHVAARAAADHAP
ncbi:MAG: NAD-dependent epimerase/dehydratase family protein [Proteobacteria bacterium]|nr:NAD-dependent epimerase/dehydratase family protein [Pseudomonadota bacterium]